ncbi:ABC transporter permease subunit [Beduinella massiliensis]|uniref:ABC transporter permease subunit n=1 Tax=Beduinella massiliensis TaxID=1852363 RepID=UPI000C864979
MAAVLMKKPVSQGARLRRRRDNLAGLAFISPWLFGLLAFTSIPMLYSLYLSFTKFDGLGSPTWYGMNNYVNMLGDGVFWKSLGVTFKYVLILVPLRLATALGVAMVLASNHRGIGVYRTVYYIPSLLSGSVAIAIIWSKLFGTDGAINGIITALTGKAFAFNWVGEPSTALYSLILLGCWHFGSSMLIFVSGIKQIPGSYYEAALLDGATPWQRFRHITLPMLTPVIFFNLIMGFINAFKAFSESLIITDGGPMNTTMLFALYIYKQGFSYFKMGYAAAMSWILLIIISVFSIFIFKSSDGWVHYEA